MSYNNELENLTAAAASGNGPPRPAESGNGSAAAESGNDAAASSGNGSPAAATDRINSTGRMIYVLNKRVEGLEQHISGLRDAILEIRPGVFDSIGALADACVLSPSGIVKTALTVGKAATKGLEKARQSFSKSTSYDVKYEKMRKELESALRTCHSVAIDAAGYPSRAPISRLLFDFISSIQPGRELETNITEGLLQSFKFKLNDHGIKDLKGIRACAYAAANNAIKFFRTNCPPEGASAGGKRTKKYRKKQAKKTRNNRQ